MENCIEELKGIESVVTRFLDLMGNDAELLRSETGIVSPEAMQSAVDQITEANRLMKIGIVGRVKAGKSSLLNAMIFEGQSVLPKAATPMTAALTTLSYGEVLSVEVDFFTEEDVRDIHAKAEQYETELEQCIQRQAEDARTSKQSLAASEEELLKKAEARARRELQDRPILCACYDHSDRIKRSRVSRKSLEQASILKAANYDDLKAGLLDYVAAEGKFMPFTKSVNVRLPLEVLKDITIIDTPGINDPVASREARTRELLKYCDVILVVSPAGQFMSYEDLELMDRIGSKEGVQELYVVASQVDTQLFGSEKRVAGGRLHDVLDGISHKLDNHMKGTLSKLKQTNPEVGTVFDQLIDSAGCRVIHTSGICTTILECGGRSADMDHGASHVWKNLMAEYPDYFSETDFSLSAENLKRLSNMDAVDAVVKEVRNKKDHILEQKSLAYLEASRNLVCDFKDQLIVAARNKVQKLHGSELTEIENKKKFISNLLSRVSNDVDSTYAEQVDELKNSLKAMMTKEINEVYRKAHIDVDDSERTTTTTRTQAKGGILNWYARVLWGGGSESVTETYATVRTGAVHKIVMDFTEMTESALEEKAAAYLKSWKKDIKGLILHTLRNSVADEYLDVALIERAIRGVVSKLVLPRIQYEQRVPDTLNKRGTLKGSEAERYIEEAGLYLRELKKKFDRTIDAYVDDRVSELRAIRIHHMIFENYRNELSELEAEIKNRKLMLNELARFEKELKHVSKP